MFAFESVRVAGRLTLDDLTIAGDGVTVVRGPSGSGKSTLLRLCNRLVAPDEGVVRYRGRDLAEVDVLAHRREVGMVFQAPVLFPGTVADNVRVANPEVDVAHVLEHAHLEPADFADREASTLSGGEAQRACLARALATKPQVLLMDEPTSALDAEATAVIEDLVRALAIPIVFVTHDAAQAQRVGDHEVHLER
jgi:putative ABC transport system ATP-binding protein